jgi:hypothetical protein
MQLQRFLKNVHVAMFSDLDTNVAPANIPEGDI